MTHHAIVGVAAPASAPRSADTRRYLRGSSLLLAGRAVSLLLNLAVQVLTVRALSKGDYGAFAYGLGVASIGSSAVLLGLDKSVSRFVPLYQERGEEGKAFGTLALAALVVSVLGAAAVLLVFALRGALLGSVVSDPLSLSLLLILIALAPLQALDTLLQNAMGIFAGARAIFLRRHLVAPGLKLAAVLLVLAVSGDAYLLAYAYVAGSVLGVALYVWLLAGVWRRQGVLPRLRLRALEVPAREVLGYSLRLVGAVLITLVVGPITVVLLEHFSGTAEVAAFRAVLPVARLNLTVFESFALLYIPVASRLFAREDRAGINQLYWRTATWIAVLTFPVFAVTFCFEGPLTLLLFGESYASSAILLGVLAVGCYVNAALGFNGFTLRVHGRVGPMLAIDTVAAVLGVGGTALLVVRYGALGGAAGVTLTFVLHNLLMHTALVLTDTGVRLLDPRFLRTYAVIAALVAVLVVVEQLLAPPLYAGVGLAGVAWLALIRFARAELDPATTFPELMRIPLARRLLN